MKNSRVGLKIPHNQTSNILINRNLSHFNFAYNYVPVENSYAAIVIFVNKDFLIIINIQ